MPRPALASEEDINMALKGLPLWMREDKTIVREIAASNFAAAIGVINAVALIAEKMDHHPDIFLYGWNKIRLTLSTHDKGGLTELDFKAAKLIDDLKF
ncbi:MAG: 4a-hydroxytetrahydrobiopterin dehydratase [Bacteroidota bacterium]